MTAAMSVFRLLDLPPVWTLGFMAAAASLAQIDAPFGTSIQVSGTIIMIASVLVMLWAVYHLRRADTAVMPGAQPRALVRSGPYRFSRNPIYVADLTLLIGFAFFLGQPFGAVFALPLAAVLTTRFIRPEEAMLEHQFENIYLAWKAEIPRWL
ncbi:MAG: isoprenylcysteine carboxylmethyltransferase family protein [Pseudomonadota bacterium]